MGQETFRSLLITCMVVGLVKYASADCNPDSSDCPENMACLQYKCIDPCQLPGVCGKDAICSVYDHKAMCRCPDGTTGNPNVKCTSLATVDPYPTSPTTYPKPPTYASTTVRPYPSSTPRPPYPTTQRPYQPNPYPTTHPNPYQTTESSTVTASPSLPTARPTTRVPGLGHKPSFGHGHKPSFGLGDQKPSFGHGQKPSFGLGDQKPFGINDLFNPFNKPGFVQPPVLEQLEIQVTPPIYNITTDICQNDGDCALDEKCDMHTYYCYQVCCDKTVVKHPQCQTCGENAVCLANQHEAVCKCRTAHTGNANVKCTFNLKGGDAVGFEKLGEQAAIIPGAELNGLLGLIGLIGSTAFPIITVALGYPAVAAAALGGLLSGSAAIAVPIAVGVPISVTQVDDYDDSPLEVPITVPVPTKNVNVVRKPDNYLYDNSIYKRSGAPAVDEDLDYGDPMFEVLQNKRKK